jgi:hypothetical protein
MTDPSSRQRERPTSTNLQLSDSNKDLILSPRWALYSKTDWPNGRLTVGRNITLTLTSSDSRVEEGSNTSTVALRVVGGDEEGTQCLGV